MTGRDFKTVVSGMLPNDVVLFKTADGKIHDIYTVTRSRYDGVAVVTLSETGEIQDLQPRLSPMPQDVINYMNEQLTL